MTTNKKTSQNIGAVCACIQETPEHSEYSIKTLINQVKTIENFQLVIIANGCTLSPELRKTIETHKNLILIEVSKNLGVPIAWNLGIDILISHCDCIFILNDDLWVKPYCLETLANTLQSLDNTAALGVEGVISNKTNEIGFPIDDIKYKKKRSFLSSKEIINVSNVSGFLFLLSTTFLKETNFRFDPQFTPAFCEEYDLAFFARSHNYKLQIITGLGKYYDHKHGISSGPKEISYLNKTIWSDDLAKRNIKLFVKKWNKST